MPSSIGASRGYHHGNLRAELLQAAERQLELTGPEGVSLRELARELGVSHGAYRFHFASKDDLLTALALDGLDRLRAQLEPAMTQAEGSLADRLRCFAGVYVAFAVKHPALLALILARKRDGGAQYESAMGATFATSIEMLDQARRVGEIDPADAERQDTALLAMLQGMAVLIASRLLVDRTPDQIIDAGVQTLLHGLHRQL